MGFESSTNIGDDAKRKKRAKELQQKPPQKDRKKPEKGKKAERWFKENITPYNNYVYFFTILVVAAVTLSQTSVIPAADDLAKTSIRFALEQQIAPQVQKENPYVPQAQTKKIIEERVNQLMQKKDVQQRIQEEKEKIKNYYKNPQGTTYIYRYDPYFYLRQADNLLEKGHRGEYVQNGKQIDNLRLAPNTLPAYFSLTPYLMAGTAYIVSPGSPSAEQGAFWMPVFMGILSAILIFFLGKYLFTSEVGFVAAITLILHPGAFQVFKGGAGDTPAINVFWTLVITFFFLAGFRKTLNMNWKRWKDYVKPTIYLLLASTAYYLFDLTWKGNFYVIPLILGGVALYLFFWTVQNGGKKHWIGFSSLVIAGLGVLYKIRDSGAVKTTLNRLNIDYGTSFFPQAYSQISELQAMATSEFLQLTGVSVLLLSLIGYFVLAYNQWQDPDEKSYLLVWYLLIGAALLSSKFYIYLIPPMALLAGYGTMKTVKWLSRFKFGVTKFWRETILATLLVAIILFSIVPNTVSASKRYPHANDAVYDMSQEIKIKSPPDTIITTWWHYGYPYEYYARRATTMDGGSFDPQRLYWVSNAFLSKDEDKATGILRMLNCGGEDTALEKLSKDTSKTQAIEILNEAVKKNKTQAKKYYNQQNVTDVTKHTHCKARPGIIVLSDELLNLIDNLNHYDKWNFQYGVSMAEELRFQQIPCSGNTCEGGIRFNQTSASVKGQNPQKYIHVSRNFTNRTVVNYEEGFDGTLVVMENEAFLMEPGFEKTLLIKGLLTGGLNKFPLFNLEDQRERIVARNVTY